MYKKYLNKKNGLHIGLQFKVQVILVTSSVKEIDNFRGKYI